ncbi:copper homeostasis protein CutC [Flexivirga meconopsidis]|uniref:copper homeostasis protein CutC n=1 Tax=Flexivirga meconopsidis TaxID=2977121 RepID=UPI00223EE23D|nr:copper homeostasis protein CutC [Flexivirga meconopsidis]
MSASLLEVIVTDRADAEAAAAGGADRLELIAHPDLGGMTPSAAILHDVLSATDLPVRVMIRRQEAHRLDGAAVARLATDVENLTQATEFVCGAVDGAGLPDPRLRPVIDAFAGRSWTFHRAVDGAPDLADAVRAALALPGCDQVLTAGAASGVDTGLPRLQALLSDDTLAPGVLVGGGITDDNLPALLAMGARGIHVGRTVRADGTWHSPVDAARVRALRRLSSPVE